MRIAFIGFGEAGQSIVGGLVAAGAEVVAAHDILFPDNERGARLRAAAEKLAIVAAFTPDEAVAGADIVFSTVTTDQSVVAARQVAPHLAPGQVYLDLNSTSPGCKRSVAALVEASGAEFVEAAVMAVVPPHRHKVPLLLAGAGAAALAERLRPLGMDVQVAGENIGDASAIKMIRSVVMKGLDAILVESMLAANRLGVEEQVLESLDGSFPGLDWRKAADYFLSRVAMHAGRRGAEMDEVTDTLNEIGVAPNMAMASGKWLKHCAGLGMRERFPDGAPEDYRVFLDTYRELAGE